MLKLTILFSVCGHMLKFLEEGCHLEKLLSICLNFLLIKTLLKSWATGSGS